VKKEAIAVKAMRILEEGGIMNKRITFPSPPPD